MRKWLAVAVATVVAVAAIAGTASARPQAGGTVGDVAASNKNFSTLVSLVKAAGGLAGALVEPERPADRVRADERGFQEPRGRCPRRDEGPDRSMNKGLLVQVLKYHVLGSKVLAADAVAAAKKNAKVPTLLGKNANGQIALSLKGGKVALSDSAGLNTAIVTKTNLAASNGVVHVINKVLVPKSVATALKKAGLTN